MAVRQAEKGMEREEWVVRQAEKGTAGVTGRLDLDQGQEQGEVGMWSSRP